MCECGEKHDRYFSDLTGSCFTYVLNPSFQTLSAIKGSNMTLKKTCDLHFFPDAKLHEVQPS